MTMGSGPMDLIARARAGEADALGDLCALYRNYMRMVVRTGLGPRLRERVELSDVVQDALVEVVRQFPQFTGQNEAALIGWLRRLVGQKLADLGRYHNRAKRTAGTPDVPLDAAWDLAAGGDSGSGGGGGGAKLIDMLALSQTSPSEAASRRELTVLLADALAALPELESEVLWLYHADNLSFESIGDRLGISRKVVRGIWARGLKTLKKSMDKGGPSSA
ncbi:MAG: sigma-70 family RNA polymerase sigma factor [Isosphaeraceae bacterium]|nr:sigma-70 family RNA polymerase sigma factor [Isosphaeraceae bacterium]